MAICSRRPWYLARSAGAVQRVQRSGRWRWRWRVSGAAGQWGSGGHQTCASARACAQCTLVPGTERAPGCMVREERSREGSPCLLMHVMWPFLACCADSLFRGLAKAFGLAKLEGLRLASDIRGCVGRQGSPGTCSTAAGAPGPNHARPHPPCAWPWPWPAPPLRGAGAGRLPAAGRGAAQQTSAAPDHQRRHHERCPRGLQRVPAARHVCAAPRHPVLGSRTHGRRPGPLPAAARRGARSSDAGPRQRF